jgi:hypothetical protein
MLKERGRGGASGAHADLPVTPGRTSGRRRRAHQHLRSPPAEPAAGMPLRSRGTRPQAPPVPPGRPCRPADPWLPCSRPGVSCLARASPASAPVGPRPRRSARSCAPASGSARLPSATPVARLRRPSATDGLGGLLVSRLAPGSPRLAVATGRLPGARSCPRLTGGVRPGPGPFRRSRRLPAAPGPLSPKTSVGRRHSYSNLPDVRKRLDTLTLDTLAT